MDTTTLRELCTRLGLPMTGQRAAILSALSDLGEHPSVVEIADRARQRSARITLATVYRTMKRFERAGGVRQVDFGEGFARFECTDKRPHYHLVDAETGRVIEFHDAAIEELLRRQAASLGFGTVSMQLTLFGRSAVKSR